MNKEEALLFIILGILFFCVLYWMFEPIIRDLANNSDCQQYCTCKGYNDYYSFGDTCECRELPDPVLKCVRKCGNKDSHYNEFTGRCYCT